MHIRSIFRTSGRSLFWGLLFSISILGVVSFGAAFQNEKSNTILSTPTLWIFGLIILPIVLYFLFVFCLDKVDRFTR